MKLVSIWFVNFDYNMFDCNVVVYGLKCHCWNFRVVVKLLEMTQCSCEIVSFNLCFVKYCADMSQRNTSQIPSEQSEPPQDRSDRLRVGRIAPTGSARREKEASRPPMVGRGRGGGTRIARVDTAGGSSTHTSPSQTVDPTQYQVSEHPHGHEYQFQDPQPHQYQFDAYQQH